VVEVVPVHEAQAMITAARAELAELERALVAVRADADAAEAVVAGSFDAETHEFVVVRLHQFFEDLRNEVNADIAALVSGADAQAVRWRGSRSAAHVPTPVSFVSNDDRARPLADPVVAPGVPDAPVAPTPDEPGVADDGVPAPRPEVADAVPAAPVVVLEPVPAVEPDWSDVRWPTEAGSGGAPELEAAFWADLEEQTPRRHLVRTARAVGLQAAAVLVVLVAVLLRIG
jgi:hypothetical protein